MKEVSERRVRRWCRCEACAQRAKRRWRTGELANWRASGQNVRLDIHHTARHGQRGVEAFQVDRIGNVFENTGLRTLICGHVLGAVCGAFLRTHTAAEKGVSTSPAPSVASCPPEWLTRCPGVVRSTRLSVSDLAMRRPIPQSDVDMDDLLSAGRRDWPMCPPPGLLCIQRSLVERGGRGSVAVGALISPRPLIISDLQHQHQHHNHCVRCQRTGEASMDRLLMRGGQSPSDIDSNMPGLPVMSLRRSFSNRDAPNPGTT
jgi:hypothetical protein